MPRNANAPELRAVAPLIAHGSRRRLIGTAMVVAHGDRMIAVANAELLRDAGDVPLAIATRLDLTESVMVESWISGRAATAFLELAGPLPLGDVEALPISAVHATVRVYAPSAVVWIEHTTTGCVRRLAPVVLKGDDAGGMTDGDVYFAHAIEPIATHQSPLAGAPLFAWLPADPVLRRGSAVVAFALALPTERDALAELIGLDDLGRVLLAAREQVVASEQATVAGEIDDGTPPDPLGDLE